MTSHILFIAYKVVGSQSGYFKPKEILWANSDFIVQDFTIILLI